MAVLCQKLAVGEVDRALQKLCIYHGGQVRELTSSGEIVFCLVCNGNSRSAFMFRITLMPSL